MFDLSLQQLLLRFAAILLIVTVHGYILTLIAVILGDRGPKYDGRLTLNPFMHLDAIGTLTFLFFSFGWIKPLVLDPQEFRYPRRDLVVFVLVGLISNLMLAFLLSLLRPLVITMLSNNISFSILAFMNTAIALNIWFVVFNFVPLPPLTASQLLIALDMRLKPLFQRYIIYTKILLLILIALGIASRALSPVYRTVLGWVLGG